MCIRDRSESAPRGALLNPSEGSGASENPRDTIASLCFASAAAAAEYSSSSSRSKTKTRYSVARIFGRDREDCRTADVHGGSDSDRHGQGRSRGKKGATARAETG